MNERGAAVQPTGLHDLILMEFDRAGRDRERLGDLLGGTTLCQELAYAADRTWRLAPWRMRSGYARTGLPQE